MKLAGDENTRISNALCLIKRRFFCYFIFSLVGHQQDFSHTISITDIGTILFHVSWVFTTITPKYDTRFFFHLTVGKVITHWLKRAWTPPDDIRS